MLKQANPGFNYTVNGPGTGDGFKTFCAGETDISDASRKIKDEEAAACKTAGIEYTELKIAYDGMTVMTSPGEHGRDVPFVRRPLCPDRPGVDRVRQVVRRAGPGQVARFEHDLPGRGPVDHRPR